MGIVSLDSLVITPEMLNIVSELDEFKGQWQHGDGIAPARLSILKKIAVIESVGSSTRIEGAKLSDSEVEQLLTGIDKSSFQGRDEQEVAGYAFVYEQICERYASLNLTENWIKQLHSQLLQYVEKDDHHRGNYKTVPIRIEAFDTLGKSKGVIFETVSPFETPHHMQELLEWTTDALAYRRVHPLIVIGIFIVLFLAIHPFQDGNGRLSRLLTTLLLLKNGYLYVPYSSMESIVEMNKEQYYRALQRTQKSWKNQSPEWEPWLLFFLRCLQSQKRDLANKVASEKRVQRISMQELSALDMHVLELLMVHGRLGIADIIALTHANRNTLKKTLAKLVQGNCIEKNGRGRASWYRHMP